jgi:glutamine amidotransferase
VGTIARFEEIQEKLRAELPDFLRRNIRGTSDSELFFHQILAQLHGKNQLEAAAPTHATVVSAISEAVARIDGLVGGGPLSTLNIMLSNGRAMYALRHGGALGYVERAGLREPLVPEDERPRPGSPLLRYVMLVSGAQELPTDYVSVEDGEIVSVSRDLEVVKHRPE